MELERKCYSKYTEIIIRFESNKLPLKISMLKVVDDMPLIPEKNLDPATCV